MNRVGRVGGLHTLGLLALGLAAGCGPSQADGAAEGSEPSAFARVINVEVREVTPSDFSEEIRLTSVVRANRDVMVAAEEGGLIVELLADRGDRVDEGQAIAKIDDAILSAQVEQARALAELATQTWERRRRLWEEEQAGSEISYLEAKYGAEQASANLRVLEERLARTTVRAPYGGILDERIVEIGAMVAPGQPVARLVDVTPVKVVAGVPERYAPDVSVGSAAVLTFDVFPGQVFQARVRYVSATVDPANRTFGIEVEIPNVDGRIKPEMVANMAVTRRRVASAVVIPQDAVIRVEDGYVVFVAVAEGDGFVAEARPVTLGPAQRNQVVVESGLSAGERLIVAGHKTVAAGDRLDVVEVRG